LMGIFLLEAFVAQVYQGAGKEVVVSGSRLDGVRISHM
jgi:hypothetical protein